MSDADKYDLQPERVSQDIKSNSGKTAEDFSQAQAQASSAESPSVAEMQKQDALVMPPPEPGQEWGHSASHVKTNNELNQQAKEAQLALQHAQKNREIRQAERKPISLEKDNDNSNTR